jgi:uncharacterized protein (TIGR00269 family)
MACHKCDREAVLHAAYSGAHLCREHFIESVETRIRRRVRQDDLLPEWASPTEPVTWVVGLSGGKDSVALTTVLQETFERDPRVELVALSIHEGIEGYRDESLAASRELVDRLGIEHEEVAYESEYGISMDEVAEEDPEDMAPCAYCGVFRRDALARHAEALDADLLLTGHNLDDEAQTALMNLLSGDVDQIAKHFDASLGPLGQRASQDEFVPRAKPLRDVPEKEVGLYCRLRDLPAHMTECPHAEEAFRGRIQALLHDLEDDHPGTRHSIMAGYEELARLAADARSREDTALSPCAECGSPTAGEVCRACDLLASLAAD